MKRSLCSNHIVCLLRTSLLAFPPFPLLLFFLGFDFGFCPHFLIALLRVPKPSEVAIIASITKMLFDGKSAEPTTARIYGITYNPARIIQSLDLF